MGSLHLGSSQVQPAGVRSKPTVEKSACFCCRSVLHAQALKQNTFMTCHDRVLLSRLPGSRVGEISLSLPHPPGNSPAHRWDAPNSRWVREARGSLHLGSSQVQPAGVRSKPTVEKSACFCCRSVLHAQALKQNMWFPVRLEIS